MHALAKFYGYGNGSVGLTLSLIGPEIEDYDVRSFRTTDGVRKQSKIFLRKVLDELYTRCVKRLHDHRTCIMREPSRPDLLYVFFLHVANVNAIISPMFLSTCI